MNFLRLILSRLRRARPVEPKARVRATIFTAGNGFTLEI